MFKKRSLWLSTILLASLMISACAGSKHPRFHSREERLLFIQQHHLNKLPASDVPLEVNERVIAWMDYFSGSGSKHFRRYLERSGKYIPMMQIILQKYGLPKDLVYVSLIESGFNTHAKSHASAVGPWQFIRSTGRRYGLRIDTWVDERQDPVKSTHAAAQYLRDLYNEFGNWYLAMAGYNAGEGRVRKAVKGSGSKNFWVHADPNKKYLRAETRDYVPKYIAANIMAKMPNDFGFGDVKYQEPDRYEIVNIPSQTDLDVIAKCAGVKTYDIEILNPELRVSATPPGLTNYSLRIPEGKKEEFLLAYAQVPVDERVKLVIHKVRRGDSLYRIAKKYGISTRSLASANGISRKARVRSGTRLVIPIGAAYKAKFASAEEETSYTKEKIIHKVRRGDTVGGIARKYHVRTSDIRSWNKLNKRGTIRIGQRLKIYKTSKVSTFVASGGTDTYKSTDGYHTVRSGETLWSIARGYGVSVSDLKTWNNIEDNSIRARQKLIVSSTPSSGEEIASVPRPEPSGRTSSIKYTVKRGDTPSTIAQKHGVRLSDLIAWNGLSRKRPVVRIGQKLVIKKPVASSEASLEVAEASSIEDVISISETVSSEAVSAKSVSSFKHTVKRGDTPGTIAQKYGVRLSDLIAWNGLSKKKPVVKVGQKLTVKKSIVESVDSTDISETYSEIDVVSEKKSSRKVSSVKYTVKRGDTPGTIAEKNGVGLSDLIAWNGLSKKRPVVKIGQKLTIKKQVSSGVAIETEAAVVDTISQKGYQEVEAERTIVKETSVSGKSIHVLKSGETLGHVAEEYGVSTKDLMRWNNISDPRRVRAGKKLVIKSAAGKSVSSESKPSTKKMLAKAPTSQADVSANIDEPTVENQKMTIATSSSPQTGSVTYKIKSGDSLWSIAREHDCSVSDLKKWNQEIGKTNKIKPGQKIIIKKK